MRVFPISVCFLWLCALCWLPQVARATAILTGLGVEITSDNHLLVRLQLSAKAPLRHFQLSTPSRLVVDLLHTDLRLTAADIPTQSRACFAALRWAEHPQHRSRVVVAPVHGVRFKRTVALPGHDIGLLFDGANCIATKSEASMPTAIPHSTSPSRSVVVVVDPGHGGHDPGAMGRRHREKDLVLAIAHALCQRLNAHSGVRAVLTREHDTYLGLRQRLNHARKQRADVFVSIHADAFDNALSHGVSVFALSQRGATSEAARWLAAKENTSELGGIDLTDLEDNSGILRSVLLDLSQTATISASVRLGQTVLDHLDKNATLHHAHVEQARFVVLKSPDIPSILVETGFISNPHEEALLSDRGYQQRIARSIAQGILSYFQRYPPRHSVFAFRQRSYRVKPEDTLVKIAANFGVDVTALRQWNQLSGDRIVQGQWLQVPLS